MSIDLAWLRTVSFPQIVCENVLNYVGEEEFVIKHAGKFQELHEIVYYALLCQQNVSEIVFDYFGENEFTVLDNRKFQELHKIVYQVLPYPPNVSQTVLDYVDKEQFPMVDKRKFKELSEFLYTVFSNYQNIFQNYDDLVKCYLDIDMVLFDPENPKVKKTVLKEYDSIWGRKNGISPKHVEIAKLRCFDKKAVSNLLGFLKSHRAVIVLSSSWRKDRTVLKLRRLFIKSGFQFGQYIRDKTPEYDDYLRTEEVLIHMLNNGIQKGAVIFDDQTFSFLNVPALSRIFVQVTSLLSEENIKKADEILARE